ncbi:importin subunit beta-4-like [Carica papaya]|uniref:importin subunit beta-4-like n=1 Tax=Carica papaya TaxID=3649 RepID=UPI000B8CF142|nr:importin subunit beta-4-like [Carica papaya]
MSPYGIHSILTYDVIRKALGILSDSIYNPKRNLDTVGGFGLEFSELREYTHGFFSNVAEILDDGFTPYLSHVVPLTFSSCNLDDGSAVDIDEFDDENINGFGGVSSDDEARDEPRVRNISIRTGVLDEKAAATQALGLFALHTKSSYAPYLEETLRIMLRHSGYFHEDEREMQSYIEEREREVAEREAAWKAELSRREVFLSPF